MRVLVVDDSRATRLMLRKQLVADGFEVAEASHGAEALTMLRTPGAPVGLALLDWNMPVMGGLECLKAIRADAKFSRMQVLMVTSESDLQCVSDALEAGANEYLMKPFSAESLRNKLEMMGIEK